MGTRLAQAPPGHQGGGVARTSMRWRRRWPCSPPRGHFGPSAAGPHGQSIVSREMSPPLSARWRPPRPPGIQNRTTEHLRLREAEDREAVPEQLALRLPRLRCLVLLQPPAGASALPRWRPPRPAVIPRPAAHHSVVPGPGTYSHGSKHTCTPTGAWSRAARIGSAAPAQPARGPAWPTCICPGTCVAPTLANKVPREHALESREAIHIHPSHRAELIRTGRAQQALLAHTSQAPPIRNRDSPAYWTSQPSGLSSGPLSAPPGPAPRRT